MSTPIDSESYLPPCSRGRVVVCHTDSGTIRVIIDRCGKWTCDACWRRKFADKTDHILGYLKPVVMIDDDSPQLRNRANRVQAGYMKTLLRGNRTPVVLAEAHLYTDEPTLDAEKALFQLVEIGRSQRIRQISFNKRWLPPDREPRHWFLAKAYDHSHDEIEQAISDAGYSNGVPANVDMDKARRVFDSHLNGVGWN